MAGQHIDYNGLIRHALLGAVKELLEDTALNGLRGDHHYYLAFNTQHPGVVIPPYLRSQHPNDMTIVLQNQFWDLVVAEDHFSVKLSFNSKPEELVIPFDALIGFLDPSVQFALQFKEDHDAGKPAALGTAKDADSEAVRAEVDIEQDDGENVIALDAFRKQ